HGIAGGAIHADLSVPVDAHETEGRIHDVAHDGDRHAEALRDHPPVVDPGASHGIDAECEARVAQRVHVHDGGEVADVRLHEVVPPGGGGAARMVERHALHPTELVREQRVGAVLNPAGDLGIGGTAAGRIVLETAVA